MAMAAELSSSGMKNSTASSSRYRCCPARNTPMIMDSGVCTAHDNAITRNVTHRACSRPGSVSTVRQLAKPAGEGDDAEPEEDGQRRQRHPGDRAGTPAARAGDRRLDDRWGERGHWPMTWFMLSIHCCGVIDNWKSLAMLSSNASAAVGDMA